MLGPRQPLHHLTSSEGRLRSDEFANRRMIAEQLRGLFQAGEVVGRESVVRARRVGARSTWVRESPTIIRLDAKGLI